MHVLRLGAAHYKQRQRFAPGITRGVKNLQQKVG